MLNVTIDLSILASKTSWTCNKLPFYLLLVSSVPIEWTPPTGITLQYHYPHELLIFMHVYSRTSDCKQLTTASRCISAPMTAGHAGTIAVSLHSVPLVTGVGHCGFKSCTRATSLTICRSIRGWITADACREGTGTTFPVATMHTHAMQTKRYASIDMHNNASKSTYYIMCMHAPYTQIQAWRTCICASACTY